MKKTLAIVVMLFAGSELASAQLVETRDREVLALRTSVAGFEGTSAYGNIRVDVHYTGSHLQYLVTLDGEVFTRQVPRGAPRAHLAFDPKPRRFTRLLPSLRVDLIDDTDILALTEAVRATGVTPFAALGFAFVDLPEDLHPVDALAIIADLDGDYHANVRLPMPPIDLR